MATKELEKNVEALLNRRVVALGGMTSKFVSPATRGMPDRLVVLAGKVFLVEVKTEIGTLSPLQERAIKKLSRAGADVYIVYGKRGVEQFVDDILKPIVENVRALKEDWELQGNVVTIKKGCIQWGKL